jgi:uncharacterized protein YdeI (YjbR/CyaY-like superfamily)
MPTDDLPTIAFASRADWAEWLETNHERADGVWVKFAKKGSGIDTVSYAEAVEAALCFGWIDGLAKSIDEHWYRQRFTPRRARSKWSQINRARAEALVESGAMRSAGLREIERAKADGRWEAAYPSPSKIEVPDDLRAALDANPAAAQFFEQLDATNRYAVLYRVLDAKRPDTRARRIEQFVAMLARGEKIHP